MFTGIVEATGTIHEIRARGNYRILTIGSSLAEADLAVGESIACDGACLTVVSCGKSEFVVEASQETTRATIVSSYAPGRLINLERAVKANDRLGGHLVSGHVDEVGRVDSVRQVGESRVLAVTFDRRFDHLVVAKGAVAVNGLSLTVNAVRPGWFAVNFIPHTLAVTSATRLRADDRVNIEFDLIGKYVARAANDRLTSGLTIEKLRESGW